MTELNDIQDPIYIQFQDTPKKTSGAIFMNEIKSLRADIEHIEGSRIFHENMIESAVKGLNERLNILEYNFERMEYALSQVGFCFRVKNFIWRLKYKISEWLKKDDCECS